MALTKVLKVAQSSAIEQAAETLRRGGLVAFPTDTVYGLGAHAFKPSAVARIYAVKERAQEKAIPVLLADVRDVSLVAAHIPPALDRIAKEFWPGGLTVVVPKSPNVPEIVTGRGPTIAVRIPNHPVALALIKAVAAPLATTSANRSGRTSPKTADEVRAELEGLIEIILDGGRVPGGVESTVLDLTCDPPRILRLGAVPVEDIERVLGQPVEVA